MKKLNKLMIGLSMAVLLIILQSSGVVSGNGSDPRGEIVVKKTTDFKVTGDGSSENWKNASWIEIPVRLNNGDPLTTKAKVLYSKTGMYFLFDCQDKKITSNMNADFLDLWNEDVVEIFLWTDEQDPTYFEYEISPLNYELPILISNNKGDLVRWMPFHYDSDRKTSHATSVQGGEKKSNAAISGWKTEFFIPYKLLRPLKNIAPVSGTKWRANMYRMDYDNKRASWSWQLTNKSFHDYESFGSFLFE